MGDRTTIDRNAKPPSVESYAANFGASDAYIATLVATGDKNLVESAGKVGDTFSVSGALEETFTLSMSSDWAPSAFSKSSSENAQAILGTKVGSLVDLGAKGFGIQTRNKFQTAQMWESSTPMNFTIAMSLVAFNDAKLEVQNVVRNLLKLAAPSENKGMLSAPGPTFMGMLGGTTMNMPGRSITLLIGTFIRLERVVVKNVDVQFDSRLNEQGIPVSAKVTVAVESFCTCFTTQDIDEMFVNK